MRRGFIPLLWPHRLLEMSLLPRLCLLLLSHLSRFISRIDSSIGPFPKATQIEVRTDSGYIENYLGCDLAVDEGARALFLLHVRSQCEGAACERGGGPSPRTQVCWRPYLGLPALELREGNVCCSRPPSLALCHNGPG